MRAIQHIREDLDAASEQRHGLRESHIGSESADFAEEGQILDERIAALWAELRSTKAQLRFGPRESIVRRARSEERFTRDLQKNRAA